MITGAGSGIGEALARAWATRGARLALADLDRDRLDTLMASLQAAGIDGFTRTLDVADASALEAFATEVERRLGRVDIVINNAGVALVGGVEAVALDDARWLMGINFWGVVHGCRAFAPALRRSGGGTIVNISSIFAMVSMPSQSFYNAAKAAVRAFSDAFREEVRDDRIRVLCVHPGGVATRIADDARVRDLRFIGGDARSMRDDFRRHARLSPEAAAARILRAIDQGRTRSLVGLDARILDAAYRLFPARSSRWLSALARQRRRAERGETR